MLALENSFSLHILWSYRKHLRARLPADSLRCRCFSHCHHHLPKSSFCHGIRGACVVMQHRPLIYTHDTDPPRNKMGRAVERLFRVINNEQPFACYIMKEVCLQSGISGLTFDPDTAAMFSTSKSSHLNRKASWKQHFSFFSPPHPPPNRQPQANLTPSKVT